MTREDIIRMARDAGFRTGYTDLASGDEQMRFVEPIGSTCLVELERFAELVAAAEREACAQACDALKFMSDKPAHNSDDCAAAIRARSNK